MESVKEYILSVFAVCVCCGIIRCLVGDKKAPATVVHTLCGILIAITVISPVVKIRSADLREFASGISYDADKLSQQGAQISAQQLRTNITDRTEAYILEKASSYDCWIQVNITLTDDPLPQPASVEISGAVSPYARSKLSGLIEADLGIPKEMQQWTYQN